MCKALAGQKLRPKTPLGQPRTQRQALPRRDYGELIGIKVNCRLTERGSTENGSNTALQRRRGRRRERKVRGPKCRVD
jgi:hypothetical protein